MHHGHDGKTIRSQHFFIIAMMYEPGPPNISKVYPDTKNQLVTVIGQLYPHQSALFVKSRVAPSHKSMIANDSHQQGLSISGVASDEP